MEPDRTDIQSRLEERFTWNWVGRKEKQLDEDLCPLSGDSEEKGEYMVGDPGE